jgi:hypothetical protein
MRLYREHPVLVRHTPQGAVKAWPVKYVRMFDMTNDSHRFRTRSELEKEGFEPVGLDRWRKGEQEALALYEGKMVQMYDHRAADVVVNLGNVHRAAQPQAIASAEKVSPDRLPRPQFFVDRVEAQQAGAAAWSLVFKDVTAPTNVRTMIAAIAPLAGFGNTLPLVMGDGARAHDRALLCANLNALVFDFAARQKVQGQHLNWFIVEQLPVVDRAGFDASIGKTRIADFVCEQVLHLSYTAHDLTPFARDLGYVDAQGQVLPPFRWDDEDRRARLAALDGLFMHLYGIGEDDAGYILDTFPIVRQQDEAAFGRFRTKDDVLEQLARIRAGVLAVG